MRFERHVAAVAWVALLPLGFAACGHELEGESRPTVDDSELTFCGADEQLFVIHGSGLSPMVVEGATDKQRVELPEICLTPVAGGGGATASGAEQCLSEDDVQWISQSEIRFVARASQGLTPGDYDVVVRNPDGSEASGGHIRLHVLADGPLVFWADPNVVFDDISTQVTVFGSNLGVVSGVVLRESASLAETTLDYQNVGTRGNRVQAVVPSGQGVSTYDVVVRSDNGCEATLLEGLKVTDTQTLTVSGIDPEFGWNDANTPVSVSGEGFQQVPRAYLNPTSASAGTVASGMTSVAFLDETRLTGVVPKGLPAGDYDLIVVNPDERVGRLDGAFKVTSAAPPVVDNVSPNYLDNSGDKVVTIEGADFDAPAVSLSCKAPDGSTTSLDGAVSQGAAATSFDATLPVSGLTQGTVCVVRVTNGDGSYSDYSAVGISNPASNLNAFVAAPSLVTARRAPAVTAGRATRAARFLYAIGGDSGSASGALGSVETTPIDPYGEPGEWFEQPEALPAPRTLAGVARIGRFLYVVGGNDGSGATSSVVRAQILDPLDAPEIVDIGARRGDGAGIGGGVWYYRVAAVMDDGDPSNPGGETLASDPVAISLPDDLDGTLVLTFFWDAVAGAKGYRIYRTPASNLTPDQAVLVGEVQDGATTSYEDTAGPGEPSGPPPRPLGATGVWMQMPALATAREALGVAAARDPGSADVWHLYAVGGRDGGDLASVERLDVTVESDGSHTVGTWTAVASTLSSPRAELTAYSVSHVQAAQVPAGTTYLYAGGGAGTGRDVSNVDVAEVTAGGGLTWAAADAMSPARGGYAGVAGAGFLFAFGGTQASPSDGNASAEIDPGAVPQLVNWNNEGVRLITPRYLAGSAEESAFIYVVGGASGGGATASVERTVL